MYKIQKSVFLTFLFSLFSIPAFAGLIDDLTTKVTSDVIPQITLVGAVLISLAASLFAVAALVLAWRKIHNGLKFG